MIKLVYGGSGSGKSSFAEQLLLSSKAERKYYLATMQVYDDEGRAKVLRHQEMRAGKGFVTIKQPVGIGAAAEHIKSEETARQISREHSQLKYAKLHQQQKLPCFWNASQISSQTRCFRRKTLSA